MATLYNDISQHILKRGINKFDPIKYNVEYRKSKSQDDLATLVKTIDSKPTDFESKVTILSISLRNFFKKLRIRKYTVIQYDNEGKIKVEILTTQKVPASIKKSTNNFVALFGGHCKHEL